MVIIVDLDEYCREGNRAKIHEAEFTENTGRSSRLKNLESDQNLACANTFDYD